MTSRVVLSCVCCSEAIRLARQACAARRAERLRKPEYSGVSARSLNSLSVGSRKEPKLPLPPPPTSFRRSCRPSRLTLGRLAATTACSPNSAWIMRSRAMPPASFCTIASSMQAASVPGAAIVGAVAVVLAGGPGWGWSGTRGTSLAPRFVGWTTVQPQASSKPSEIMGMGEQFTPGNLRPAQSKTNRTESAKPAPYALAWVVPSVPWVIVRTPWRAIV